MSTPVPSSHITIEENVERLKRFAWLERAAMRTLAGWLPGAPEWDAKNAFGLHVWESADAANTLRARLRELRAHQPERGISPALQQLAQELDYAQNTAEVIAGVYLVVKKQLLEAYRTHPDSTWNEFDNPTVKVTESLLARTEQQVAWAEDAFAGIAERYPGWQAWADYLAALLASDGGVTGAGAKSEPLPPDLPRTRGSLRAGLARSPTRPPLVRRRAR